MTEHSYLWTTGGAGDGASTYTRSDWAKIGKILAATHQFEGVAPNWLNAMAGTVTGANTVAINTGGAVVDGKPYDNDASLNVNIPSAVGGGNTRIDRIVLRADWTAQTVRVTRIAGTDAASPTAPAITTTSGTTYDVKLYQALVNTSGTVTLTDERTLGQVVAADIATAAVTSIKIYGEAVNNAAIATSAVSTAKIVDDAVDDTKVGNRVPQFYRRQGGSATNWLTAGTSSQTPTTVRMQAGAITVSVTSAAAGTVITQAITFPTAFSNTPIVFAMCESNYYWAKAGVTSESSSGFTIEFHSIVASPVPATYGATLIWFAVGPE